MGVLDPCWQGWRIANMTGLAGLGRFVRGPDIVTIQTGFFRGEVAVGNPYGVLHICMAPIAIETLPQMECVVEIQ
jgi:hypothetical protein